MTNKRTLYIFSGSILAVLLLVLALPLGISGRIIAAVLLLPAAVLMTFIIKKRSIYSINTRQVILLMSVIALVYLMLYYVSGLYFGFYKNPYRLTFNNFWQFALPIAVIIVSSEIMRAVVLAQGDKWGNLLVYLACVAAELLTFSTIPSVTSFAKFMDLVALTFFPAIISNLLYHYLSKRYGMVPSLVFRLATTLHAYLLPIKSGISDSLLSLFKLLIPLAIFLFIDALFEKKRRRALAKKNIFSIPVTVLAVIIMVLVVMLVSNQFYFGALVIATGSMTGELNKGDVAIFERYEDQFLGEGQVIVFEKDGSMIVHRIVDIEVINENKRYYTKGDANDENDAGFITDSDIVGLVNHKVPYFGFPTLWLRSLFKR